MLFCHATPRSDTEIFTARTPEATIRDVLEEAGVPLVICGHTHMQFDRAVGRVRVVNAGSVGMPFGEPGAHWALLGPASSCGGRRTTWTPPRGVSGRAIIPGPTSSPSAAS